MIAYEQVALEHEAKTQFSLSLSMPSVGQVLETIDENLNAIRSVQHVNDKRIQSTIHDQKNPISSVPQVASSEESVIKGVIRGGQP